MNVTTYQLRGTNGSGQKIDSMLALSEFLDNNFTPPIIVLGVLGNLLNLITLFNVSPSSVACCCACVTRKHNSQTAAMSLLVCMSATDLFFLLAQLPGLTHPSTYEHRFYECNLRSLLSNFGLTAVALFGACIAVERYAAVRNKDLLVRFFRHHVRVLLAAVTVFSLGVNVPRAFERQPNLDFSSSRKCNFTSYYKTTPYQILWYVTVLVNSVLPLLVMVSFASMVARTFMRIERQHKSMRLTSSNRAEERIALATRMMAVSIVVFAASSIGGIITVLANSFGPADLTQRPAFRLFRVINNLMTLLKSSVNFGLYCTTSALYRKTLRNIVLCRKVALLDQRGSTTLNRSRSRALSQAHTQLQTVSNANTEFEPHDSTTH